MKKVGEKLGFTLVELLIVISIIVMLSGVAIMVINPAALLQKTRDARRLSEINGVNTALSSSISSGKLVLADMTDASSSCMNPGGWLSFQSGGVSEFLPRVPNDPVNLSGLCYFFMSTRNEWELNAVMENIDSLSISQHDGGNDPDAFEIGADVGLDLI